jgi:hypothetical protein
VLGLVVGATNPGYYVPIKEVRQRKNTRNTENMKFLWGGNGIGHATIKVETHRHRQKDKYKDNNNKAQPFSLLSYAYAAFKH